MSHPLIYFVRHGQTDWNVEYRLQGQEDIDINAFGQSQADRNGGVLRELIAEPADFRFVASPLRRTRETMERVRRCMGLPPMGYDTDPRLMELHFGAWQGSTFAELEAASPGSTKARATDKWNFIPPGAKAESYAMLALRVQSWLAEQTQQTVCVTHGGIVRTMFRLIEGMSMMEAANLEVRQDRIVRLKDGRLDWI